jgi:flagellar biosynthesis anti-sigma factor FlgM
MRISDSHLNSVGTAQTGQAQRGDSVSLSGGKRTESAASAGAGQDRVELSGLSGQLSRVLGASSADRSAKVSRLSAQFQAGTYQVDAQAVSRSMVKETLARGV